MNKPKIPIGYQQVMPYLLLNNADQFVEFVKNVFDASEKYITRNEHNKVQHGEVQIGDSTIMFSYGDEKFGYQPAGLFVYVADADETYNKAIKSGAIPVMGMSDQPYGRAGGIKDPFGNTWWVTTDRTG